MAFGSTPISTTTLGTNQYPVSAVAVPGHSGGNLTAVEGGPASTDGNGNETAPVSSYIKDGGDAAQGTTTDAANANTVVGQLKQIKTNTASVVVASLPALPAGTNVIGHVIVDSAGAVSVTSLPSIPAGTNVIGHVIVDSASSVAVTALPTLPSGTNVIGHIIADSGSTTAVTSLPALPTGGNTIGAVTQAGTWTVQPGNTANTTAWKVDGSGVTQPVSGTVTANVGTTNGLALDASVNGLLASQGSTTSGEKGPLIQGAVTTAAPAYTTAQTSPISLTTAGAIRTDASATTQPISGTITANIGTAGTLALESGGHLANIDTHTPATGQATMANSSPVTIASNQSTLATLDTNSAAINTSVANIPAKGQATKANSTPVAIASDQGDLLVKGDFTEQAALSAAALNADLVPSTDVSAYREFSLHITALATGGTLTFQGSNDNVNFVSVLAQNIGGSAPASTTSGTVSIQRGFINYRYLRVRQTAWTSGSTTATLELYTVPSILSNIGTAQNGTWTVQPGNTPNTTAWKVDGSAVTQPISGAVTQGAGAVAGTNWRISGDFTEQASLSAASLNADLVPSTDVSAYKSFSLQILTVASGGVMTFQGCNDNATWQPVNYYFASTQASPGNVQGSAGIYYGPCVFRYLRVRQTSWTSGSSTGILELYTHAAGIPPTNITVQNNSQATGSGIGTTDYHLISAASTNATNIKGFNGQVYGYEIGNSNAANRYVKLYNKSSTPTVGTDTPFRTILVPPNGRAFFHSSTGLKMPNGIGIATTTGIADTDSTAVGLSDLSIDIDYV